MHGVLQFLSLHPRNAECHFPMQKAVIQAVSSLLQLELAHQNLEVGEKLQPQGQTVVVVVVEEELLLGYFPVLCCHC